ncbi:CHAD domain-containing protein [Kitasatospora sp. NPDC052896]|uniref:CYTH and CHAD domain-containing protein n=1 Tax=Kitasatospora sp. NPDC052896 TaxID=3364061 RepID=UPI0037CA56F5
MAKLPAERARTYQGLLDRPVRPGGLPGVAEVVEAGAEDSDAVHYDTADLRLRAHGVALWRRTDGGRPGWLLTLPGEAGALRELSWAEPTDARPAEQAPEIPAEATELVRAYARGAALRPVLRVRTSRARTLLLDARGRTLARLDGDEVRAQVLDRRHAETAGWAQTAVTLLHGRRRLLRVLDRKLRRRRLRPLAPAADRYPGASGPVPHPVRPESGSTGAALTAYLRAQTSALLALDGAVRRDEPDAVHRMRVCARRLRSALTSARPLLRPGRTEGLREELRLLGQVLGAARDAETTGARLAGQAAELPAVAEPARLAEWITDWSDRRYQEAHREAREFLDGERYFALLAALEQLAAEPPLRARAARGAAESSRLLRREQRRTRRRIRAALAQQVGPHRDEALHDARKAAKRARYTAELVGPGGAELARRMRAVQEALGGYQDAVVAERLLPELASVASSEGLDGFGFGILYARQRQYAEAELATARTAWRRAAKASLAELG